MTLDSLVRDMVAAAEQYPGIDLIWYRAAVETTLTVVNTFIGIVLYALMIGMPLILAIELLFINFPPLTAILTDREDKRNKAGVEKAQRNWGLFLNDVRKTMRIHMETGGNINVCYFKIKWKTLFSVTFIINILFFGEDMIIRLITKACGVLFQQIAMS